MPVEVLIVEDLHNVQSAMAEMLQGLGDYRIAALVPTEAEALAWLDANRDACGLAIIDLALDQGTGMSVISRCRSTNPTAKVVVFSSFVTDVIRAHCIHLGADEAFDKNSQLTQFADYCSALSPLPAH